MYHDSGDNVSWDINKNVINLSSPGDLFFLAYLRVLSGFVVLHLQLIPRAVHRQDVHRVFGVRFDLVPEF
jgi:hypothetical protein